MSWPISDFPLPPLQDAANYGESAALCPGVAEPPRGRHEFRKKSLQFRTLRHVQLQASSGFPSYASQNNSYGLFNFRIQHEGQWFPSANASADVDLDTGGPKQPLTYLRWFRKVLAIAGQTKTHGLGYTSDEFVNGQSIFAISLYGF